MAFGLSLIPIMLSGPAAILMALQYPLHQAQLHGPSGANRLVGGIISFARWPDRGGDPENRTLCVMGTPQLMAPVAPIVGGKVLTRIIYRIQDPQNIQGCDIIYLGQMAATERQQIILSLANRPILTITDDDPNCSHGSMFCLYQQSKKIGFSINLDAIKRGNMRVDPRVLRIGREG